MDFPKISITDAGIWESPNSPKITPTRLVSKFEIECYTSGTGRTCINGEWCNLQKNSVSLSRPLQFRFSELPFSAKFIYFEIEAGNSELGNLLMRLPCWVPPNERFEEIFTTIIEYKGNELRSTALLIELLYLMEDSAVKSNHDNIQTGQREIAQSIAFMKKNLDKKLSVAEMAQKSGYSQPHFTHLFHKYLNTSPYDYFIELKLNKAEKMLLNGSKVFEIYEQLGFDSASHFCSVFQKKRGTTPKEFTKRHTYSSFKLY